MKTLRTLSLALPLLVLAGCGCTGDESGFILPPNRGGPFLMGVKVAPVAVRPPDNKPVKKRIDVLFLMDDSGVAPAAGGDAVQAGMVYGSIAKQPGRVKQAIAQAIFQNMVANLKADLLAKLPAEQFDLAFGVARYEDFGGSFHTDDQQARPFILNQPIYRQERDDFTSVMNSAWIRTAPGNGNNSLRPVAADNNPDAQSIVEALFQVGTGLGFDGNGNASKADSGPFGDPTTQTAPGISGDVPAAVFTAAGLDEDGEPKFTTPGTALASGNLGGAGWRPDALHYVITTSDISGVAPFPTGLPIPATIVSTAGGAYPRDAKAVVTQAFATITGTAEVQKKNRFGELPNPVAPVGAATVQSSVDALNTGANPLKPLNIEVLSIGTPRTAPVPTKPNLPGGVPPNVGAIVTPTNPDPSPFTWMSAYAILTGARRPWPPVNPTSDLPLVYNLSTVFPSGGVVGPDVREDLVYRIEQGLPTLPVAGAPGVRPPLTPAVYDYSPSVVAPPASPFVVTAITALDADGAGTDVVVTGQVIRILVPRYWSDEVAPPARRIDWQVQFTEVTADNLQKSGTLQIRMLPVAISPNDPPPAFTPTPPKPDNVGTVFTNWPPAPPNAVLTTLDTNASGCTIVKDVNSGTETSGGTCP